MTRLQFVFSATICNYTACDLDNIPGVILCKGTNEFLCIEEKACLVAGEEKFPIGVS